MFRRSTAQISVLLLSFFLVPSGRIYAATNVVTGSDPQPTGEPKGNLMWLELEVGLMMALQVS